MLSTLWRTVVYLCKQIEEINKTRENVSRFLFIQSFAALALDYFSELFDCRIADHGLDGTFYNLFSTSSFAMFARKNNLIL